MIWGITSWTKGSMCLLKYCKVRYLLAKVPPQGHQEDEQEEDSEEICH